MKLPKLPFTDPAISQEDIEKIKEFIQNLLGPKNLEEELSVIFLAHHETKGFISFGNACELCMFEVWEEILKEQDAQHEDSLQVITRSVIH
jgi:hypothetical protein